MSGSILIVQTRSGVQNPLGWGAWGLTALKESVDDWTQRPSIACQTRMHSSRMRTGRSLTVCCSMLSGGGVSAPEGVPGLGGVPGPGGSAPGGWGSAPRGGGGVPGLGGSAPGGEGCLVQGGLLWRGWHPSMHWGRHPSPPPLWDRQTLVKILPWPNFVAAGNQPWR